MNIEIEVGSIVSLNNGEKAEVISVGGWKDIVIKMKRGNTKRVQRDALKRGNVMDPMKPSLCGVGFMGVGEFKSKESSKKHTPEYSHWHDMICRCYNEKRLKKFPTYEGCTVCPEWHDFQVFAEWFKKNYVSGLELDKDIKTKGNKVYSPDTCLFVTREENNEAATSKSYEFKSPSGDVVKAFNLSEFCRANSLTVSCMSQVSSGIRVHHKGWTANKNI